MHEGCAASAQGIGRTNTKGKPELLSNFLSFQKTLCCSLRRHRHTNFSHQLTKGLAVFCNLNGLGIDAYHAHTILFPNTHLFALNGEIQCCLSAHRGKHRINFMLGQNAENALRLQGQQVNIVGNDLIGHDGCRVAVDECYGNAFFAERTSSL